MWNLQGWSFVLSGTSRGKWGSGVFKKVWPQPPLPPHLLFFFWNSPLQTLWVHVTVNNKIDKQTYNLLMEDNTAWYKLYQMYKIYFFLQWHCNKLHSTIQSKKNRIYNIFKKGKFKWTKSNWTLEQLIDLQPIMTMKKSMKTLIYNHLHSGFFRWAPKIGSAQIGIWKKLSKLWNNS